MTHTINYKQSVNLYSGQVKSLLPIATGLERNGYETFEL